MLARPGRTTRPQTLGQGLALQIIFHQALVVVVVGTRSNTRFFKALRGRVVRLMPSVTTSPDASMSRRAASAAPGYSRAIGLCRVGVGVRVRARVRAQLARAIGRPTLALTIGFGACSRVGLGSGLGLGLELGLGQG